MKFFGPIFLAIVSAGTLPPVYLRPTGYTTPRMFKSPNYKNFRQDSFDLHEPVAVYKASYSSPDMHIKLENKRNNFRSYEPGFGLF